MPELPEVESLCRQIAPLLIGARVIGCELTLPRILRQGSLNDLTSSTILSVNRIGKFIQIAVDREFSLFIHLRMTGQLFWDPPDRLRDRYTRSIVFTDRGSLYFRDVRSLGGFWICQHGQFPWKRMGIDPLAKNFDIDFLQGCLSRKKLPVKVLLLDQSLIAGIGNIYASEILFKATINPQRQACSITNVEAKRLHRSIRRILQSAIDAQGTTFRDFRLSDGREGAFQEFLKVYGHEGDPCRKCSTPIIRIIQSARSAYYCPKCQPLLDRASLDAVIPAQA